MAGKADLVESVSKNVEGITKKQAGEAVDAVFGCITRTLVNEDTMQVPGFGSFRVSHSKERQGRNPKTGEPMTIAASNKAAFKAGKGLKDAINS